MDITLERLAGEGETKTIIRTRIRRECEYCSESAHYKHTFLLVGTRNNPLSKAWGRDDCSWCEDEHRYVCKEHEHNRTPPDGYVRCSTFPASEQFAHLFLKWHEREV